jgi:glucokinase
MPNPENPAEKPYAYGMIPAERSLIPERHGMGVGHVLAMDIGGTKIAVGLVKNGKIRGAFELPTGVDQGRKGVEKSLNEAFLRGLSLGKGISKAGIGIAGGTDHAKGVYLGGPHFPKSFRNVDFRRTYGKTFGVDIKIDNDVHCFALGEARHGLGKGASRVVGIAIGTGIGGGIVIDGAVERGAHNLAAELGHMTVDMASRRTCECGGKGHLEAYASGSGISAAYEELTGAHLRATDIAELADTDRNAAKVYREARSALAAGISSVLHAFDPDVVILGGGLSKEPLLWNGLMDEVRASSAFTALKTTKIVRSALRSNANLLGAAALHHVRR